MPKPKPGLWRALSLGGVLALGISISAAMIFESYPAGLDTLFDTTHSKVVTEDGDESLWSYEPKFKSAKEAYEGYGEFAQRLAPETFVLLKNQNSALPLASDEMNVTLMGLRSYAPVYGNSTGSCPDFGTTSEHLIYDAFEDEGFSLNPSMLAAYKAYCDTLSWAPANAYTGLQNPEYNELKVYDDIPELSLSELASYNSDYNADYASYKDAAIVVFGRPGGESANYYLGGEDTPSGNVMGLSSEEREILNEAKENFDKVIVLINSVTTMEYHDLVNDEDIDAIMWIGYPGAYGFIGVADILKGSVNPSAKLGDIQINNNAANPAMQSFGNIPWANASDFASDATVNSYLVEAEGIYSGYRYYETRYAEIVKGNENASKASAGTYTASDGSLATVAGTWDYSNEVSYPFGAGLSYTTFTQTLDSVSVRGNKETASVTVTVTNTGDVAGKDVVQLYAQTPYTDYDKQYGVEKSAIQLMDFEKTDSLEPGQSQTITMEVELCNLASYDYQNAETFIVEDGTYYFAIGSDSHDALNNILAAQNYDTGDGMDAAGDESKVHSWTWDDGDTNGVDAVTFSGSVNNVEITNQLSEGGSSMDLNYWMGEDTVTYMSRDDFDGTFPESYAGLSINDAMAAYFDCDVYEIKNDGGGDLIWGSTSTNYKLTDLANAEFDDERWDDLLNQATMSEFMAFSAGAFHAITGMDAVGLNSYDTDDGPGGSDTHFFDDGSYQGTAWSDAEDYAAYGSRVTPAQQNIAYSWNKALAYENGVIILGETSVELGLPIMIGPAMNLHRHGYNGRGGEYLSEDPILSGFIGSNIVQGAESMGCLVNLKHVAFNDQEINRSGIAVFMNEQKAREMELRNFEQVFAKRGQTSISEQAEGQVFDQEILGIMSSYNRIGCVAPSANEGVMVKILREEWGFKGYNVTDFTSVSTIAMPKESLLYGTNCFCGFGASVSYWDADTLQNDSTLAAAIKQDLHYGLWAIANSNAMNGISSNSYTVQLFNSWRILYTVLISVSALWVVGFGATYAVSEIRSHKASKEDK